MPGKPQPLGSLIGTVIDEMGVGARLDEARAIEAWGEVAGPAIQRVTESAWMRRGTLFVKIESAVWRQELHLQRTAWCERLNRHVGKKVVSEIRFC
ncbi:MAG TPA: DUF721 domain-containing protein [Rhodothermales bacterium]